ncbi:MAG TPA: efflux RND transporter periplasmic adaptor subunit [Vicinamibacterales bacterium]|jgi:RND family efflux transporter MFP subunit
MVIVMISVALAACRGGGDKPAASVPPAKVDAPVKEAALTTITLTPEAETRLGIKTATVDRRAIPRTRTVGGEIIAPAGAERTVTAPFAGTLESPEGLPTVGTTVTRGQPIFRLVPIAPSERDARVDAERAVGEAAARQEVVAKRAQRAEQMARDGSGSKRAAEEAQAELAIANADLKAARDRLALAARGTTASGAIALEAPFTGLLRNLHASAGQTVAASAPLFDLVRLDTMWVRAPIYVGESADVDRQAPARVLGLGEPAGSEGILARPVAAPPSADPSTAGIDLYYALANARESFRPGQRVGVRLTLRGQANTLVVPRSALLHDAFGGTWVYEAREPRVYARRRVSVADLVDQFAVLDQGPAPGTRVVVEGAAELFGTEFGAGK